MIDPSPLADEIAAAYAERRMIVPPTARDGGLSIADAYLVERELARRRVASGRRLAGRKVGYANKAVWRALKLDTLVWANMYDDTVDVASGNDGSLSIAAMVSPKIEPEIVFKLKAPLAGEVGDAAAALAAVDWMALGFEIIDSVYADWKFQPADFVAAFGLHAALVVGEPRRVDAADIPALAAALPSFTVRLSKNGTVVEEGSGKNSLRSPASCLAELANAMARQPGAAPLAAGELISSGTLTTSMPLAPGERWTAEVSGLDLPPLSLTTAA